MRMKTLLLFPSSKLTAWYEVFNIKIAFPGEKKNTSFPSLKLIEVFKNSSLFNQHLHRGGDRKKMVFLSVAFVAQQRLPAHSVWTTC